MVSRCWPYVRNTVIFFPLAVLVMILFERGLAWLTGDIPRYTYRNLLGIIGVLLYSFVAQLAVLLSPIHTYVLRHERVGGRRSRWSRSGWYGVVLSSLVTAWLFPTIAWGAPVLDIIPAGLVYGVVVGLLDAGRPPSSAEGPLPGRARAPVRDYLLNAALFLAIAAIVTTILLAVAAAVTLIPAYYFPAPKWFAAPLFAGVTLILAVQSFWFSAVHTFLLWRVVGADPRVNLRRSVGLALALSVLATFGYIKGEPKNLLLIPAALVYGWAIAYLLTRQADRAGDQA